MERMAPMPIQLGFMALTPISNVRSPQTRMATEAMVRMMTMAEFYHSAGAPAMHLAALLLRRPRAGARLARARIVLILGVEEDQK